VRLCYVATHDGHQAPLPTPAALPAVHPLSACNQRWGPWGKCTLTGFTFPKASTSLQILRAAPNAGKAAGISLVESGYGADLLHGSCTWIQQALSL